MNAIMRDFTKEQLVARIETQKETALQHPECSIAQMDLCLAEIALASLEAEAVAWRYSADGMTGLQFADDGALVKYDDYAALEDRCAALAAELNAVLTDRAVILEDLDICT